jgi:hypothetical protein
MKKQFPLLELMGGVLGIVATVFFMSLRVTPNGQPAFYSEQMAGNIIFTLILLAPYVIMIIAAFRLPARSRWPILVSSTLLSLLWLTASGVSDNFPDFPRPHTSPSIISVSLLFFFPATVVLLFAAGLSLRRRVVRTLPLRQTIILVTLSVFTACLLGVSLYVLFLDQSSELWTRAISISNGEPLPNGEWIHMLDWNKQPNIGSQEFVNFGIVRPLMAWISFGLLALGVFFFAILFKIAGRHLREPDSLSSQRLEEGQ